jgi:hypothetical protein
MRAVYRSHREEIAHSVVSGRVRYCAAPGRSRFSGSLHHGNQNKVQGRSSRVLVALVTLAVSAALPVSQLAIAGSVTVTCCCGPHDAQHKCGCDNCPALGGDGESTPDPELGMAACDLAGDPATAPWSPAVVLPGPALASAAPSRPWSLPTWAAPVRTRVITPPCPDG